MCRQETAVAAHQDHVVAWYLAVAAFAARLDDRFGERRHAPHVRARELTAAGVDGQRAAGARVSGGDERAGFSLAAEAVVLERNEHGERVAIVELGDLDVFGADPGHGEGGRARERGT